MSAAQDRHDDTTGTPEDSNAAPESSEALITRGFVGRPWPAILLATESVNIGATNGDRLGPSRISGGCLRMAD